MVSDSEKDHLEGDRECQTKRVLMTPELMNQFASRDIDGHLVTWEWKLGNYFTGEWTPLPTVHHDDKLYTLEEARLVLDK